MPLCKDIEFYLTWFEAIFSAREFPDLPPALAEALALLHSSLDTFRQLNIDPAEFACMKAIVLFKPGI